MSSKPRVWRIPDWDAKFEVSQGRRYPNHTWFSMSNRMDTDEQIVIMDHKNGLEHLGISDCMNHVSATTHPR